MHLHLRISIQVHTYDFEAARMPSGGEKTVPRLTRSKARRRRWRRGFPPIRLCRQGGRIAPNNPTWVLGWCGWCPKLANVCHIVFKRMGGPTYFRKVVVSVEDLRSCPFCSSFYAFANRFVFSPFKNLENLFVKPLAPTGTTTIALNGHLSLPCDLAGHGGSRV